MKLATMIGVHDRMLAMAVDDDDDDNDDDVVMTKSK